MFKNRTRTNDEANSGGMHCEWHSKLTKFLPGAGLALGVSCIGVLGSLYNCLKF